MFMTKEELTKGYTFGDSITLVVKITEINPQTMVKINISTLSDIQRHSAVPKPDLLPFLSSPTFSIPPSSVTYQCQLKDNDTIDQLIIHLSTLLPLLSPNTDCNNDNNNINNSSVIGIDKSNIKNAEDIDKSCSNFAPKNDEIKNKRGVVRKWELRQNNTLRPSKPLSLDKSLLS